MAPRPKEPVPRPTPTPRAPVMPNAAADRSDPQGRTPWQQTRAGLTADQAERDYRTSRPGLLSNTQAAATEYDNFWKSDDVLYNVGPWLLANPEYQKIIKDKVWTYRNSDGEELNAFLFMNDFVNPFDDPEDDGGGRGRGGGGGGGRSKEEQELIDIENMKATIKNMSESFGIQFDDGAITALATTVVRNDWAQDRLTNYIVGAVGGEGGWDRLKAGSLTKDVDAMKALANDNLLGLSDETARHYAQRIASGELDMDTVRQILRDNAKTSYSWAGPAIDSGISVRDFLMPSRDAIADELEMNANDVDLMDPKWLSMMQVADDKGAVRAATQTELRQRARQDERFKDTTKARDLSADIAGLLRSVFEGSG